MLGNLNVSELPGLIPISHPLLFVTVSGAHLYGFPSRDSDYDLRGAHILPIKDILGLNEPKETITVSENRGGVEVDLVTHDIKKFSRLLLKRNGYAMEQLYSPIVAVTSPEHEELKEIAKELVTRGHGRHYLGFSMSQWELFEKETPRRVKPLLYTYRTMLTGIHLMRTGEIEANLKVLNEELRQTYIDELIKLKMDGGENAVITGNDIDFHRREYERLRDVLQDAMERSPLPEAPTSKDALNDLLIRVRMDSITRE